MSKRDRYAADDRNLESVTAPHFLQSDKRILTHSKGTVLNTASKALNMDPALKMYKLYKDKHNLWFCNKS